MADLSQDGNPSGSDSHYLEQDLSKLEQNIEEYAIVSKWHKKPCDDALWEYHVAILIFNRIQ